MPWAAAGATAAGSHGLAACAAPASLLTGAGGAQFRLVLPGRAQVYLTLTQEDRRYRPRAGRLNGQGPFEKRLYAAAGAAGEYAHAIGLVVVRRAVLEAARAGAPLRRADAELVSAPFRRARDVGIYSVRPVRACAARAVLALLRCARVSPRGGRRSRACSRPALTARSCGPA